jgi:hypothetical protein
MHILLSITLMIICIFCICSVNGACDLCNDFNWLFIASTGRSGSTTVLNMINDIPGIYLRGENYGVGNIMYDLHKAARRSEFKSRDPFGAWQHSDINKHELLCRMQAYVVILMGNGYNRTSHKVIGFKEIRFRGRNDVLEFMSETLFPCAKFIINTREDASAQEKSRKEFFRGSNASMVEDNNLMLQWAQKSNLNKDKNVRSYFMTLEADGFTINRFNQVLPFLGVKDCAYTDIYHSNDRKFGGYDQNDTVFLREGNRTHFHEGACTFDSHAWPPHPLRDNEKFPPPRPTHHVQPPPKEALKPKRQKRRKPTPAPQNAVLA